MRFCISGVSGQCSEITSLSASIVSNGVRPSPAASPLRAESSTRIPNAAPSRATAPPSAPAPTMPRVDPARSAISYNFV